MAVSGSSVMIKNPVAIVLVLFGVLPWTCLKEGRILSVITKVYSAILSFAAMSSSCVLFLCRWKTMHLGSHTSALVSEVLTESGGLVLFLVTVLASAFWNARTWLDLFRKIRQLRTTLGLKSPSFSSPFLLGHLCLLTLMIIDFSDADNFSIVHYYSAMFVHRYFYFLTSFAVYAMTFTVLRKYKALNRLTYPGLDVVSIGGIVSKIRRVRIIFLNLVNLTQCFNKLAGWPMLFLSFYSMINVLNFVNFLIFHHKTINGIDYNISKTLMIVNIGYIILIMVWLTAIIFCCDSVAREADKLLTNCYRLEQSLPMLSKELEELESLKRLIINKRPRLTAAGFFEIRRSTLLSLLSTTTTYFIVALQFNSL